MSSFYSFYQASVLLWGQPNRKVQLCGVTFSAQNIILFLVIGISGGLRICFLAIKVCVEGRMAPSNLPTMRPPLFPALPWRRCAGTPRTGLGCGSGLGQVRQSHHGGF